MLAKKIFSHKHLLPTLFCAPASPAPQPTRPTFGSQPWHRNRRCSPLFKCQTESVAHILLPVTILNAFDIWLSSHEPLNG